MSVHIPGSELYADSSQSANGPSAGDSSNAAEQQSGVAVVSNFSDGPPIDAQRQENLHAPEQASDLTQREPLQAQTLPHVHVQQQQQGITGISAAQLLGKSGMAPRVEVKLFVGRLPRTMEDHELTPLFTPFGEVLETVIIRDKVTHAHKGSAFIKMASLTDADAAVRALHNLKVVDNQLGPIQVKYANGEAERLGLPVESAAPGVDLVKLFVGSLPRGVSEQEVRAIFEPYGAVEEVVLMKDQGTGQTKGCAFVKFKLKETAIHAIKALHGQHECPGCPRPLEVKFAESRRGGGSASGQNAAAGAPSAATGVNAMQFGAVRQPMGVPSNLNPRSAGGWTEYFTTDNRAYYHNEATGVTQWTKPPEFDRLMVPPPTTGVSSSSDVTGPPGANVFVFHIPNEWGQAEVIQHFSPFGRVISCYIATDKQTGRNKGYGFVSFDNIESSVNAVLHMNGFLVGSKRLKVSIKTGEGDYVAHLLKQGQQQQQQQSGGVAAQQQAAMYGTQRGYAAAAYPVQQQAGYAPGAGTAAYGAAAYGTANGAYGAYGPAAGGTTAYGAGGVGAFRSAPY